MLKDGGHERLGVLVSERLCSDKVLLESDTEAGRLGMVRGRVKTLGLASAVGTLSTDMLPSSSLSDDWSSVTLPVAPKDAWRKYCFACSCAAARRLISTAQAKSREGENTTSYYKSGNCMGQFYAKCIRVQLMPFFEKSIS